MTFPLNPQMFDFLVLSILLQGDSYGYQISQRIKRVSDTKDSALYPVLKRLQEQSLVETYDQPFQGRNRRYYHISEAGTQRQEELLLEWEKYKTDIDQIIQGGIVHE